MQTVLVNFAEPVRIPAARIRSLVLANARLAQGSREDWALCLRHALPGGGLDPLVEVIADAGLPILAAFRAVGAETPAPADAPLVAVIMVACDAASTIADAMRSVLAQTHRALRLVVVDDASTDGTMDVARGIAASDQRVVLIWQPTRLGPYAARNAALAVVAADHYTFHCADAWMHPARVARHLAHMADHPDVACSYSAWVRLDATGRIAAMPAENPGSCFFRRDLPDTAGYFDMVRIGADEEFAARLRQRSGAASVVMLDEILTVGTWREGDADDADGPVRRAYADAWADWHRAAGTDALCLPYPQSDRVFDVPADIALPPEPSPHPFSRRPGGTPPPAEAIVLAWPLGDAVARNWGDKLSPALVHLLSGKPVLHARDPLRDRTAPVHLVIGSGLSNATAASIVWGSGFIDSDRKLGARPLAIRAVRGPLSRARVLLTEDTCTDVFGDPALLFPLFYNPAIEPDTDIGIIQHCREARIEPLPLLAPGLSVRVISINGGLTEVVDGILSCRHIVSSSLHGIVAAHAYGRPASWVKFSDRPLGDGFKFKDYWASMGRAAMEPIAVRPGQVLDHLAGIATPGHILVDLHRLIRACPFIGADRQEELVSLARSMVGQGQPGSILDTHAGLREPLAGQG
jgi:hypothetical protein